MSREIRVRAESLNQVISVHSLRCYTPSLHYLYSTSPFDTERVTTTQGMVSLLPIGRHLCSFAHIRIRATLLRIAASAKLSHVILRIVNQPPRPALTRCRRLITLRFRCLPHAIPGVWSATILSCDHPPIIMRAQLRTYSLLNSLIHLLLSSLCSQSATCSFLFRVFLLLAVVN